MNRHAVVYKPIRDDFCTPGTSTSVQAVSNCSWPITFDFSSAVTVLCIPVLNKPNICTCTPLLFSCYCITHHNPISPLHHANFLTYVKKSKVKVKSRIAVHESGTNKVPYPSHNYGVSLAIWDHTVLPSTRHKRTHPAFTQARQAGTRFTDHLRVEG